jgi:hypothetical protein
LTDKLSSMTTTEHHCTHKVTTIDSNGQVIQ